MSFPWYYIFSAWTEVTANWLHCRPWERRDGNSRDSTSFVESEKSPNFSDSVSEEALHYALKGTELLFLLFGTDAWSWYLIQMITESSCINNSDHSMIITESACINNSDHSMIITELSCINNSDHSMIITESSCINNSDRSMIITESSCINNSDHSMIISESSCINNSDHSMIITESSCINDFDYFMILL